ncbi:excinuclease ABC subunit B [Nonlabens arenilitoris]|uniref:Excinuclease ABC subunit B n=1 Tax=Nonlabens arenilitoris TaxID=1217969 RepID=A0A2S7U6S0_9FLAO|nr:excinuclease ABC subunit B [Nonlabens arenilitoris]PQJ30686.1 excinuclease ABC subunit B [Nonlabens arenilitoris]
MKQSIKLFLTLVIFSAFAKAQSGESYQSLMMKYFEVSGIDTEYNAAYDGMMQMFKDAYQTQDVPASVWQKYDSNKTASVAKLKGILASEYRSIFDDKQDLINLINFYTSSAGKQLKSDPNAMSEDDKKAYEAFRVSNTGTKLFGRMDRINKAKETASIYWSRELFCQVTGELKELGYTSSMPMGSCN